MAEISRKRVGELVRGVFHILQPHPEGLPGKLVLERLPTVIHPTDFENSTYPKQPDIRRYEKIVRFSTIDAVQAGWLIKDKGLWSLTDEGRRAFTQFPAPEGFALEAGRLYRQWRRQQPIDDKDTYSDDSSKRPRRSMKRRSPPGLRSRSTSARSIPMISRTWSQASCAGWGIMWPGLLLRVLIGAWTALPTAIRWVSEALELKCRSNAVETA